MERFHVYPLPGLLPQSRRLVLDQESSVLTLLDDGLIIEQVVFSWGQETTALFQLLESYPDYCPYEEMMAKMSGDPVEKIRERVGWAEEQGDLDVLIRPLRNLVARCRLKVRPFGVDVKTITFTGYMLGTPRKFSHREEANGQVHR